MDLSLALVLPLLEFTDNGLKYIGAGLAIGLFTALLTPIILWPNASFSVQKYQYAAPFVIAIAALLVFARRRVVSIARTET